MRGRDVSARFPASASLLHSGSRPSHHDGHRRNRPEDRLESAKLFCPPRAACRQMLFGSAQPVIPALPRDRYCLPVAELAKKGSAYNKRTTAFGVEPVSPRMTEIKAQSSFRPAVSLTSILSPPPIGNAVSTKRGCGLEDRRFGQPAAPGECWYLLDFVRDCGDIVDRGEDGTKQSWGISFHILFLGDTDRSDTSPTTGRTDLSYSCTASAGKR